MKECKGKGLSKKITSILLIMAMLLTMIPMTAFAAGATIATDKDTYVMGEPIYVNASSTSDDWVGFYTKGQADGESYWYWYYVKDNNGKNLNIYDAVYYGSYNGEFLQPGTYEVRLENNTTATKTISITEPESRVTSLEVEDTDMVVGESVMVKLTSYTNGAWAAVYDGAYDDSTNFEDMADLNKGWTYVAGRNGLWLPLATLTEAGDYTVVLFKDSEYEVDKLINIVVKEAEIPVDYISTDKTVYEYGEAINVTTNYKNTGAWVGLYKKGENPNDITSIHWYSISSNPQTVDINTVSNVDSSNLGKNRPNDVYLDDSKKLKSGEYTVVVFADGNYITLETADFVIKTSEHGEPVVTPAKCETPGNSRQYYTDGTFVDTPTTALEHDWGKWVYDEETKTHSSHCSTSEHADKKENCNMVLVPGKSTPAGNGQAGKNHYECTVCGGEYDVVIPADEYLEGRDEVVDPTCEDPGYTIKWYKDAQGNEYSVKVEPTNPTGHAYGSFQQTAEGAKTHTKVCVNDAKHVITEDCEYGYTVSGNEVNHKCSVCNAEYTTGLVVADKKTYKYGEDIIVTSYYHGSGCWVGIYKPGETPSDSQPSICWYYVTGVGHEKNIQDIDLPEDITSEDKPRGEFWSNGKLIAGEYRLIVSVDGNYNVKDETTFTVVADQVGEGVREEPTCEKDGKITITYEDGTTKEFGPEYDPTLKATQHTYGDYVYAGNASGVHKHTKVCSVCGDCDCVNKTVTENCNMVLVPGKSTPAGNGQAGKNHYECTVCGGEYDVVIPADEYLEGRDEVVDPTCEDPGYTIKWYKDAQGNEYSVKVEPTNPTGHAYGSFHQTAENAKTHTKVCANDAKHVITENCTLSVYSKTSANTTYKCSVCEGFYVAATIKTDKTSYQPGETITVTTNFSNDVNGAWVGLYYKNDTYGAGQTFSIAYYYIDYVNDYTIELTDPSKMEEIQRPSLYNNGNLLAGDYKLVLFSDGNYDAYQTIYFTVEGDRPDGGDSEDISLSTDKTTVKIEDGAINVTATCTNSGAWVGLYKVGDVPGTGAGTVVSFAWYDMAGKSGQTVNLLNHMNTDRTDPLEPGTYRIILFGDSGYYNILKEITITIEGEAPTFEVILNGTVMENGQEMRFPEDTQVTLGIAGEGFIGTAWVGVYNAYLNLDTDFTDITAPYWYWISQYNGEVYTLNDYMDILPGDYTIVIFSDGGKTNPIIVVNFTITREGGTSIVHKQPTCTDYGKEHVTYEDGTSEYLPIAPLGHKYETKPIYNAANRTHTAYCDRCKLEATAKCTFDDGVVIKEATTKQKGEKLYTCTECGGTYVADIPAIESDEVAVDRVSGENRYETALNVAEQLKEQLGIEKFQTIILTRGDDFADAMSAGYLSAKFNAPIIITSTSTAAEINAYILANLAENGKVYIIGGPNFVPDAVVANIAKENVERIYGANRYETNLLVLKEAGITGGEILVCTGNNFADSLAASVAKRPILLVGNALKAEQKAFVAGLKDAKFIVIGGEKAVGYAVESELRKYGSTERVSGANRYETSVKIAERFFKDVNPDTVALAYGLGFADALCGSALAMNMDAPIILVNAGDEAYATEYVEKGNFSYGITLGGTTVVSDETVEKVFPNKK